MLLEALEGEDKGLAGHRPPNSQRSFRSVVEFSSLRIAIIFESFSLMLVYEYIEREAFIFYHPLPGEDRPSYFCQSEDFDTCQNED